MKMSSKKALCVGINHFANYPSATRQGCVNDANNMASVLKVCHSQIPLLECEATKRSVIA